MKPPYEMLENLLLDIIDVALSEDEIAFALAARDLLLILHDLKRRRFPGPDHGLPFAVGPLALGGPFMLKRRLKILSRKHNTRHPDRSVSRYPDRLAARGVSSASVRMESLTALRKRQLQRISVTGVPWATRLESCQDDELLAA